MIFIFLLIYFEKESDILEFQRLQREEMKADREQRESFDHSISLFETEIKSKESHLVSLSHFSSSSSSRDKKGECFNVLCEREKWILNKRKCIKREALREIEEKTSF